MTQFSEAVDVRKIGSCKSCSTYTYVLPCSLETDFGRFLAPSFGPLAYPLDRMKIIMMNTNTIMLKSRVGKTSLEVKFKTADQETIDMFNIAISAYIEEKTDIVFSLEEKEST